MKQLLKICRDFILSAPFYGLFLSTLNKVIDRSIPTAGVTKNGINVTLIVNDEFLFALPEQIQIGVIHHELLHICFFHLMIAEKYADKEIFNIAADIHVNQYIPAHNKNEQFLALDSFPGIKLDPHKGTKWYYEELMKNLPNCPKLQAMSADLKANKASSKSLSNHNWKEFEKLTDQEKQLIENQLKYQLKEAADSIKDRGFVPGELKTIIDSLYEVKAPSFDWKGYLRRFAGGSVDYYTKKTQRKRSNRFIESPGLKIKSKKHILIAVDTSGSVNQHEFTEFLQEIHHIYKTGCSITFLQADAAVCNVEKYKGKPITSRYGNGGTDFTPAIDYLNKNKRIFSSCIYFTDGECSAPSNLPQKPTLWVHCSTSPINKNLPGYKIQINGKK